MAVTQAPAPGQQLHLWFSLRPNVLTLLAVEGLGLQSFSCHLAFLLVAGSVFFLCLPCSSRSEPCGGESYGLRDNVLFVRKRKGKSAPAKWPRALIKRFPNLQASEESRGLSALALLLDARNLLPTPSSGMRPAVPPGPPEAPGTEEHAQVDKAPGLEPGNSAGMLGSCSLYGGNVVGIRAGLKCNKVNARKLIST
eukprot:1146861-Pelagomonas_calceolata.AAC.2